jgi:hypothetical protein
MNVENEKEDLMSQESFEQLADAFAMYKSNLESPFLAHITENFEVSNKAFFCCVALDHILQGEADISMTENPVLNRTEVIIQRKGGRIRSFNPEILFDYFISKTVTELYFMKYCSRVNLLWLTEDFCDTGFEVYSKYPDEQGE